MNWPLEGRTNSSKRHSSNCMNCKKVVSNSGCKHDFNTSHYVVVVNAFTLLTSLIHQNCFYTLSVRTSSSTGLIVSQRIASLMLLAFWDSLFHQKPKKKKSNQQKCLIETVPAEFHIHAASARPPLCNRRRFNTDSSQTSSFQGHRLKNVFVARGGAVNNCVYTVSG